MNVFSAGKRHVFVTSLQQLIQFHIKLNSCLLKFEITKLNKSDVER